MHPWLARVRHDLVKRACWPARDLCELLESGSPALPPDLQALRAGIFELPSGDGTRRDARALWRSLVAEAPREIDVAALEAFAEAIDAAMEAVARAVPEDPKCSPSKRVFDAAIDAVLALEKLFADLAREQKAE